MRLAYLAAGAGGMYCGSCMHDNRLAATLVAQGRDVALIPLYTPLRTDEAAVGGRRVYYGGISVYLQQASALFRRTPWFVDRFLDAAPLLRAVGRLASSTRPEALGALTLSVLKAEHGAQRKELRKLVAALRSLRPDLVHVPNLMFTGVARHVKATLGLPVSCGLAGEDIFLEQLSEPHRSGAFDLIQEHAAHVDAFVALTDYYARHAAGRFSLPAGRVHRLTMGIRAADFREASPPEEPFTIGYLARVCPQKGLAELVETFLLLRRAGRYCRLRVAGHMQTVDRPYFKRAMIRVRDAGLEPGAVEYVGEVTRAEKLEFLRSLHVLSMPTTYAESKGFYVLEALAAGVPVVLPNHGAFPELVQATSGGLLHERGDPHHHAHAVSRLMDDPALRRRLAAAGRAAVHTLFTSERMAAEAWTLFERLASPGQSAASSLARRAKC